METKKIIGIVMLGASVGLLVYLYKGFLKPRLEVDNEIKSGKTSPTTTTTTTK
jgi:hypothetical protein